MNTHDEHMLSCLIGYNGIYFGDGRAYLFFRHEIPLENGDSELRPMCETTIASLMDWNEDLFVEYDLYSLSVRSQGSVIRIGEGSMGNEGCVVSFDEHGNLNWYIFLDMYNPFTQVEVEGGVIKATSSLGTCINVELEEPRVVRIKKSNT